LDFGKERILQYIALILRKGDIMKLLGSSRKGQEQLEIYYFDDAVKDYIVIVKTDLDIEDDSIINQEEARLSLKDHKPINLLEPDANVKILKEIFEDILTQKYPSPTQIKYLQFYVDNPDDLLTRCVINCCKNNDCICPLFFTSLGCIEFITTDIIHNGELKFRAKPLMEKKVVARLVSYLRQKLELEEFSEILARIRERMEQDNILRNIGGYR
jgi:hypothetical protein